MMPPVSLPRNGGTVSARTGAHASIPHTAIRLAAPILRIADSLWSGDTLKRNLGHGKNGCGLDAEFLARCFRVALDLARGSRHRPLLGSSGGSPMHNLFAFLKQVSLKRICPGAALGVLFGLLAFSQAAEAAYPWELNFWLSGPNYDGLVKPCEAALGTITSQFQEKESTYWNSSLQITAYGRIHETAFRPWQSDNIPRRYCSADVLLNDGKMHKVHYSILEDGGFA